MAVCLGLLSASACRIQLDDPYGRACDEEHPCSEGRVCFESTCRLPSELPGSDAGDAGAETDAGHPFLVWSQTAVGFDDLDTCSDGCQAMVTAAEGNKVWLDVPQSATSGYSYAVIDEHDRLPATVEGRLRGRVILHHTFSSEPTCRILELLDTSGQALLDLRVTNSGALQLSSSAGTLTASGNTSGPSSLKLSSGQEYVLELAWRQGAWRRLWVNGTAVFDESLPSYSEENAAPRQLLFQSYPMSDGACEVTFVSWKLTSDPETPISD